MSAQTPEQPRSASQRRHAAALGWAAAAALAASTALPYWQAKLFAPQYRQGLTATMYAWRLTGDVQEIDELNHYIGMRRLEDLAAFERLAAVPAVLLLAAFCAFAFWRRDRRLEGWAALAACAFPLCFFADMAFWMRWSATHLDPTAPLKFGPFFVPPIGIGKVAQFRSEMWPRGGFYLAVAAALAAFKGWRASQEQPDAGLPKAGTLTLIVLGLLVLAAMAQAAPLQPLVDAAAPGSVLELPAGAYEGPVTIAKPLTLRGAPGATVANPDRGTVVTVKADGVVLEGLRITGSGEDPLYEDAGVRLEGKSDVVRRCRLDDVLFGVFLVKASGAVIEGTSLRGKDVPMGRRGDLIRGWNSDGVVARGNTLEGGRDFVLWFSTGSRVENNVVRGGRYGLHFMYTNGAVVSGNRFVENSVGLYIMYSEHDTITANRFELHRGPSGAGLGLKESDWLTVEDNDFIGNRQGIYIDGAPLVPDHTNVVARNVLSGNDVGLSILPGVSGNVFTENAFEDNLQQVSMRGGGRLSGNAWERDGRGNFWSDYAGYGRAGAAVGALPYRVESAWESLTDRQPSARFFAFTPAAQAVDLAARAFPIFRPKAVLEDPSPLLRAPFSPQRTARPQEAGWTLPFALASLSGLLLGAPPLLRRRARKASPAAKPALGGKPAVRARGVGKAFGERRVLSGVSFEVAAGETVVLWGANGAGKSTLIKCLLGLHDFEGCIEIFGRDCARQGKAARELLGFASQEPAALDWTVEEAMSFIADLRGVDPAEIGKALERCGLSGERGKRACDLSGGMRQKLSLAQALLAGPPLLVLDEPCSSLDAASRRELLRLLRDLKSGRAIVMTTHRADEARLLADRVLWLEEGAPARMMTPAEFARAAAEQTTLEEALA